ncbi:hypothetical protein JCM1841_006148 [Sporobolomyces salmonicolor]
MPSKSFSASSAAPTPDPTPPDLPVAPTDEARAASSSGGNGSAGAAGEAGEGQRAVPTSKDDQQISQILAEMSQQQHSPPMTTRSKGSTASPAASTPPLAAPTSTVPPPPLPSYPSAYPPSSPRPSAQREPSSRASTARDGPPLSAYSAADPATSAPASLALPDLSAPASAGPDRQAEEDDELDVLPSDTKPNRPAKTTAKGKGKGRGRGKSEERQGMNDIEWERSRKDNHKEVERRRRETINAGISSLAALLPPLSPSDDPHSQSPTTAPSKLNKGLILSRAAAYIEALKAAEASNIERWTLEKLLSDQAMGELRGECERLRREGSKWEEEVEALRERVRVLEEGEPDGRGPVNAITKRAAEAAADGGERKRPRPHVDELP